MGYDGTLKFDTKIDTSGFKSGVNKLKGLSVGAAAAVGAGLGAAVKKGMDFEGQMSTVGAISLASAGDMEKLTDKAKEMGIKTVFSATEAGQAMEYMAMAGWKTGDMLGGISGIMDLAAASGENLGSVSDIVTDALTAFGLSAADSGRFADVLAAASSNSNTNVSMMGDTFKYVAPVAGALGYSVEDTSKAIGLMANAGIKGSQAGTSLRAVLSRLAKPTKETQTAMKALGVSLTDSKGNMKSLDNVMLDLRAGMKGLDKDQQAAYAAMLGGQEAMSGLLAIANASEADFNKLGKAIENSSGSAKKMSEIKLDNLQGQMTLMGSAAEGLGIAIYEGLETPLKNAVKNGSEMISELAASVSGGELSGAMENVGEALGTLVEGGIKLGTEALPVIASGINAISANIVPLSGTFVAGAAAIGGYKLAVTGIPAALGLVSAAATALTNPIGMVGAAVGLGAAAFVGIKTAIENARTEFFNMGDALDSTAAKYQTAKEKADVTEDYAARWRELNAAINDGSLSAEQLGTAEAERKNIEQWFIDNYGAYISAEQQKNGVRSETVDLLEEQAEQLSEIARLELENEVFEKKSQLPELIKEVGELKNKNKELDNQNLVLLQGNNSALKALSTWKGLTQEQRESAEGQRIYNEVLKECSEALGNYYYYLDGVEVRITENDKAVKENNKTIGENQKKLTDAQESIDSYASSCKRLIEVDIGTNLETLGEQIGLVRDAQTELAETGGLSQETIQKLSDAFPEMAEKLGDSKEASSVLETQLGTLSGVLDTAKSKAQDFGLELEAIPNEITVDVKLNVPDVPKFARGTKGAKKGPAIVNDGNGPELIEGRDGSFRMVSSGGSALTYLNRGDRVYTAEQTRAMLKRIPHYADGVGNVDTEALTIKIANGKKLEGFDRENTELEVKVQMGLVGTDEYVRELERIRDKYFHKETKEYWEQHRKINEIKEDAAEDAAKKELAVLDRKLRRNIISEDEYYHELELFRDKYYEQGSDEWENYTDRLYDYSKSKAEKARDDEFAELDKMLSRRFISEAEYYDNIEKLRDKYFEEGSDEWQKYTDKIIDYNVNQINAITDDIKGRIGNIKNNLLSGLSTLSIESVTIPKMKNAPVQVAGVDPKGNYSGATWTRQSVNLQNLKNYRENMQMYYKAVRSLTETENLSNEFYEYLLGLGMDEGYALASTLMNMSDEDRKGFLSDWDKIQDLSDIQAGELGKGLAENLYGDDVKTLVVETAGKLSSDFIGTLSEYFKDIPADYYNIGYKVAESFASGFNMKVDSILLSMTSRFGRLAETRKNTYNNYSDNRQTIINAGDSASAHDIIEANYQNELYQSHTKGW